METNQCWKLKPETKRLLALSGLALALCYALSAALYCLAGTALDYQLALIWSERLAAGLRAGFGLLCIGFLFMECR